MEQYDVTGMSCAACQAAVEKAVNKVDGVQSCSVSLLTNSMAVEGNADSKAIIAAVEKAGYGASLKGSKKEAAQEDTADHEIQVLKNRLIYSVVFLLLLMYITMGVNMWGWPIIAPLQHNHLGLAIIQMVLAIIVMVINKKFFVNGFRTLFHGSPNMDTLIALGSSASFGWSFYILMKMTYLVTNGTMNMDLMELYHNDLYFESAAMIPALITVGKLLEAISKGRTTDALKGLMKLAPKKAVVLRDGKEEEIDIEYLNAGDLFVVRPGDSIPADGIVQEGSAAINESALTGESVPVDKEAGDQVSAATINTNGYLVCKATRVKEDTTLSQIIKMVSDASTTKAPIARIADKVSGVFVPVVISIALLVMIIWLLLGKDLSFALARAISVLVISCPCALGLATPVAIMVGNGMGAKNGILFKTSESLEETGKVKIIALDKTGTITTGKPAVTDIQAFGTTEEELMGIACALEAKSEHPLAKAIVEYANEKGIVKEEAEDFKALTGSGIEGTIKGVSYIAGSKKFVSKKVTLDEATVSYIEEKAKEGKTPLLFASDTSLIGVISVADQIKEDSARAIASLHKMGIYTVMLTGDNELTANAIAQKAGVKQVVAGVMPDEKEAIVKQLMQYGKTAMVGDGINDAPALTRADIGIAIGAGTDVAIDSADVVLMNSNLTDVVHAIRLSRQTLKNIHENLFWAFFYNLICIPLAAGVTAWKMNPMIGAATMSLSSFTVCMNALRLNLFDMKSDKKDKKIKNAIETTIELERKEENMEKVIQVEGMMCMHCEAHVKEALEKIDGVTSAKADHEAGTATVTLSKDVDDAVLKKAINDAGYKA